ncbi:prolyl oligopeptidase family serine peptidase [Spirosoma montaniterrae]|uniref:Peptidase S9 n=1 Tax=Spirosoma montaniterrae TaxID=1178516 RepID=A0A1P9WVT2_9BACT|nr:prolyl oligopeptidase family serine peptidase [Spirosoma montaniterrae]AQG79494.1 hypothetical protein AWR27_09285 [Spirosoma montaniterrae]
MKRAVILFLLLFFYRADAQTPARFSIDDVLSAPYCSNLTAGSDHVVWVSTTEGVRNVYVYTPTSNKTRKLTSQTVDDGQDFSEFCFSPDGRQLAYVRGSGKNREGVSPNPTSNPAGAEQAVYVVAVDGNGQPRRIGAGSHPTFSPSENQLLFMQGGQVMVADLVTNQTKRNGQNNSVPTKLFSARGFLSDANWSPDGSSVLFVSNRGYHNLIGVYRLAERTITWLAPDVDRDKTPVWSPDGKRVAFLRQPGQRHGELENIMGGNRFAVWVADVATGEGRELWHSPADDGGFAQYYPAEPLRWTAANQLLFFSEHQGWMHVYALSPDSPGQPRNVTGNADGSSHYEAEETCLSPDGKTLYFSANNPANDTLDIDRRHIWRVSTDGSGKPELLTPGTGIETDPVLVGDRLFYRSAGWNRSTGIAYRKLGEPRETTLFPQPADFDAQRFPTAALVEPKQVILKAADGTTVHAQLFLPPPSRQTSAARHPGLIFLHGGPMRQMLLGWHYRGSYYANAYAMNQYLASQGYVVLSVNFRAGIGYGRAFRRADKQGPRGASEYQDVLAGAKYLQNRADVDPLRIGLWGGSYGGYLTAMGLARNSDLFAAGVDLHGVHDWSWRGNMFSPGGGWGIGEADMKVAFESSPNHNLDFWRSPCLFVHGDDDRNVTFAETVDLVQKLRARNVPTEVLIFPDDVHSFLLHKNWVKTYKALDVFFGKYLLASDRSSTATK